MNRALRVGDRVTFRDGAHDAVPAWFGRQWQTAREAFIEVVGRPVIIVPGRRKRIVEVELTGGERMKFYAGSLRLDDRPRFWKRHDEIEAEKVAARAAKKGTRR